MDRATDGRGWSYLFWRGSNGSAASKERFGNGGGSVAVFSRSEIDGDGGRGVDDSEGDKVVASVPSAWYESLGKQRQKRRSATMEDWRRGQAGSGLG